MDYSISELLDIDELRPLCELFSRLTGLATAILDMEGNVLAASGWQDICSHFHRRAAETLARCRESEQYLAGWAHQGERYTLKRCENGLYDLAVPLVIDDRQVGSLFAGQFLLEPPDVGLFRRQAARFGFDETSYLDALARVPVVSGERVQLVMEFLRRLATMIGGMGLANRNARRASLVVENSPVVLFRWRATEGRSVKFVSENVVQFGYTPEEFLSGEVVFESMIHPDDLGRVLNEVHAFSASGVAGFQQEYRIVTRDGRVRWVDNRTSVERDQEGRIIFYQGVMIDVTERKRMEKQQMLIQVAFDHNFDACFWITPRGRITYVNEAACRSLGYTRDELLAMTIADIDPDWRWDGDTLAEKYAILKQSRTMVMESRHMTKVGVIFPVEICNNFVEFEGEEFNCTFVRDIRDRKRMEDALRLSNRVVENSQVVLFRWRATPGWPVDMVSRNVSQFGYTPEEFVSGALLYASIIYPEGVSFGVRLCLR
jgi:PAS domain S-box-containing protein